MFLLNNRSSKLIGAFALTLLSAALLFNLLMHKFVVNEQSAKVNCSAFFLAQSGLQTNGVMNLNIDGKRLGEIDISATVRDSSGTIKYHLLRNVSFAYRHEDRGYLTLQLVDISKKASDDMTNELFNKSLFDFSVKSRRLRITMVGDSYLLWNGFSPVMICIRIQ